MLEDAVRELDQLQERFTELRHHVDIDAQNRIMDDLEAQAGENGFWDDPATAQEKMQRLNTIRESVAPWVAIAKRLEDTRVLVELAGEEADPAAFEGEVRSEVTSVSKQLDRLEIETLLSGAHDASNAYLEINSGAGGDEANDWAQMLLRMYLRWAERRGFQTEMLDEVPGDVAGIKSVTVRVIGHNAYGLLQGERGVHRLVRLSPFNANNKRQTSFAGVDVVPEVDEVSEVIIDDKDLRVDVYRSSGAGGQHVNKTSSAVRVTHIPTNIVVAVQNERSQHQNKEVAMKILKSRLLEIARQENKASIDDLRGERRGIEFGSQIRNYVFQPYTLVKDLRTGNETGDIIRVMDGEIEDFVGQFFAVEPKPEGRARMSADSEQIVIGKGRRGLLIGAQTVHSVAFALWLGGIIATGALAAPCVFLFTRSTPLLSGSPGLADAIAGGILRGVFHGLVVLSLGAGIAMLFADTLESVLAHGARFRAATFGRSLLTIALLAIVAYQGCHILPIMDRPFVQHTSLFDSLHAQDVLLTQLQVPALLLIALITAYRNVTWLRL